MVFRILLMFLGYMVIYMTVGDITMSDILFVTVGGLLITMAQYIEDGGR
jgi:hypothetical protein